MLETEFNNQAFSKLSVDHSVGALITVPDGRYLMQLRDNAQNVNMRNNWGVFGGWLKEGEPTEKALLRELDEELEFVTNYFEWFTEITYLVPGVIRGPIHKTFYHIKIQLRDVEQMVQHEGSAKNLFKPLELAQLCNVLPWDLCAVLAHWRRVKIQKLHND